MTSPPLPPLNTQILLDNDPIIQSSSGVFDAAASRWGELIIGDLPDVSNSGGNDLFNGNLRFQYTGSVDDIVIGAQLEDFPENDAIRPNTDDCNDPQVTGTSSSAYCNRSRVLGLAGPTFVRSGDPTQRSTIAGVMSFDRLDFKCCSTPEDKLLTIMHEMGHIFGECAKDEPWSYIVFMHFHFFGSNGVPL